MIRYICIFVTIFLVASKCDSEYEIPDNIGVGTHYISNKLPRRIVGGEVANITEVPYQVALLLKVKILDFLILYPLLCGGSIISKSVIVSAAHCFEYHQNPKDWKIRAGSTYYASGGQLMNVSKIIVHPGFNSQLDNDISLMILTSELTFGPTVQPIPLASVNQVIPDNLPALASGWGFTKVGGNASNVLRKVIVFTWNYDKCAKTYSSVGLEVSDSSLCAGTIEEINGVCEGDSGGPLVVNNTLVGIVSWGVKECVRKGFPSVYASVPVLRQWIDDTLDNLNVL